jgi:hypothetical protein
MTGVEAWRLRQSRGVATPSLLNGLFPGMTCDLTITVVGKRQLVLRDLVAPASHVVAIVEPPLTLTGGFGLRPGQDGPMQTIDAETPTGETINEVTFDDDCTFELELLLPPLENLRLRASGEGWSFDALVPLPEHGNPPFLCLHPPCPGGRS